ncbi:MAG: PRC-barrel domain containing protein [Opitutaceae bacterium]|jgi:sporulation protein YlmC with PRC-barrel domain
MLLNIKHLYGVSIAALDFVVGEVKDFYFDDKKWVIRYMVADTGVWLPGRLVLISPHAFGPFDSEGRVLSIKLTKKKIEDSPSIESHRPVSRQYEVQYYRHYGWPSYWIGGGLWGGSGYPTVGPLLKAESEDERRDDHRDDKHLRSVRSITGYHIQAIDGTIGHVSGLLVDDKSWAIRELVVETSHWYSGKEVLISHGKIERISYEESKVFVSLTMEDIQRTAEHAIAESGEGKST